MASIASTVSLEEHDFFAGGQLRGSIEKRVELVVERMLGAMEQRRRVSKRKLVQAVVDCYFAETVEQIK